MWSSTRTARSPPCRNPGDGGGQRVVWGRSWTPWSSPAAAPSRPASGAHQRRAHPSPGAAGPTACPTPQLTRPPRTRRARGGCVHQHASPPGRQMASGAASRVQRGPVWRSGLAVLRRCASTPKKAMARSNSRSPRRVVSSLEGWRACERPRPRAWVMVSASWRAVRSNASAWSDGSSWSPGLSAGPGRPLLDHHGRGGRRGAPAGAAERERPLRRCR